MWFYGRQNPRAKTREGELVKWGHQSLRRGRNWQVRLEFQDQLSEFMKSNMSDNTFWEVTEKNHRVAREEEI